MEKIEKEITLKEYLRTNGVAEGEVEKWVDTNLILLPLNTLLKILIFYWDDFDFYDYRLYPEFKILHQ
jgi:hypothetical protein